jgi:hypothetical protein
MGFEVLFHFSAPGPVSIGIRVRLRSSRRDACRPSCRFFIQIEQRYGLLEIEIPEFFDILFAQPEACGNELLERAVSPFDFFEQCV